MEAIVLAQGQSEAIIRTIAIERLRLRLCLVD
jgi:hypothetical protein